MAEHSDLHGYVTGERDEVTASSPKRRHVAAVHLVRRPHRALRDASAAGLRRASGIVEHGGAS